MKSWDVDVLISGAGPAGLMLACELRTAGVAVAVVEPRKKADPKSPLGAVLEGRAKALGVEVWRGHELLSFGEDAAGVAVDVRTPSGEQAVLRARFLAGCDEGLVRKLAGVECTNPSTRFCRGNVFFVGDAAQLQSSERGWILGLLGAVNLGWKLAGAVKGWAPEGLLDTYSAESHAAAERALSGPSAPASCVKELPAETEGTGRFVATLTNAVDVVYPLGNGHALLGRACPDLPLVMPDGSRRQSHDIARDGRALLLELNGRAELGSVAFAWAAHVRYVVARAPQRDDVAALFVRPDGYVAWAAPSGKPPDADGLRGALTTWLGAASG